MISYGCMSQKIIALSQSIKKRGQQNLAENQHNSDDDDETVMKNQDNVRNNRNNNNRIVWEIMERECETSFFAFLGRLHGGSPTTHPSIDHLEKGRILLQLPTRPCFKYVSHLI